MQANGRYTPDSLPFPAKPFCILMAAARLVLILAKVNRCFVLLRNCSLLLDNETDKEKHLDCFFLSLWRSGSLHNSEPVMMPSPPLYVEILAFVFFYSQGPLRYKAFLDYKKSLRLTNSTATARAS